MQEPRRVGAFAGRCEHASRYGNVRRYASACRCGMARTDRLVCEKSLTQAADWLQRENSLTLWFYRL